MDDFAPDAPSFDAFAPDATSFDTFAPDAPRRDGFTPDSGPRTCNNVVADGPSVPLSAGVGIPPAPMGGTIVPGHYVLTSLQFYGFAPPPGQVQEVLDLTASRLEGFAQFNAMMTQRVSETYVTNGSMFIQTPVCPMAGAMRTDGYTATATQFTIIQTMAAARIVGVFDRR